MLRKNRLMSSLYKRFYVFQSIRVKFFGAFRQRDIVVIAFGLFDINEISSSFPSFDFCE